MSMTKNNKQITLLEFQEFYKSYVFDKLRGISLGSAFSKKFNITDNCLRLKLSDEFIISHIHNMGYIKT
jgi:hypothetical protein